MFGGLGMMGMPMPPMGMPMGGMGMGMMPGMMGMGGMGMGGMGMMNPMMSGMPMVMPGMGHINSLPGRFGRDMLGRDYAGPGGVGASQPYRPPDPSALPPMPTGMPFIARPGQEGFDQYGRMIPPELPEGYDGWGRQIIPGTTKPPASKKPTPAEALVPPAPGPIPPGGGYDYAHRSAPMTSMPMPEGYSQPAGGPGGMGSMGGTGMPGGGGSGMGGPGGGLAMGMGGGSMAGMPNAGVPGMGMGSGMGMGMGSEGSMGQTPTSAETGRPEQPNGFDRPPANADSYFRYEHFDAFALNARALNEAWKLHLPRELVGHDVNQEDWGRFIDDLRREALAALHDPDDYTHRKQPKSAPGAPKGPMPILTDGVHSLLASWHVAFFAPRGIRLYAAQDGKRAIPPPIESHNRALRGYSRADEFSDDALSEDGSDEEEWWEDEEEVRRNDMYLPRMERHHRSRERMRERRMQRRLKKHEKMRLGKNGSMGWKGGEWEVHFVPMSRTLWAPGMRPRTYGEPVVKLKR